MVGLLVVTLPAAAAVTSAAGATVAVLPAGQTVAPGSDVDVTLQVTDGSGAFNAFDTRVLYDPAVLSVVQLSPLSQQIGSLMRVPGCSLFHRFSKSEPGVDSIACSLLCAGGAVLGPGTLYRLRFHASSTPQIAHLRLEATRLLQDGTPLAGTVTREAVIGIGVPVTLGADPPIAASEVLRIEPNPARGRVRFLVRSTGQGALEVFDATGRRRWVHALGESGDRTVVWDGHDPFGRSSPPGLYLARLRFGRITLLRRFLWLG